MATVAPGTKRHHATHPGQHLLMPVMQSEPTSSSQLIPSNAAIWVHDEKESWVEARAERIEKTIKGYRLTYRTESDPQNFQTCVLTDLPALRNTTLNESRLDDLTELTHLNEASVLKTVRERYLEDDIYTYSGIVLVSVNPYRKLDLYSNELIWSFKGQSRAELGPHLFAVAEEAFQSLVREGRSQSIIVSGESGAGKTISAKYIMRYLAEVCKQGSELGGIESKILATNPILEAFGNAKTVRNDNSSRFGKYVQILVSAQDQIIGAEIQTFLLETTRVVGHAAGERNYHVFYQMLAGLSDADRAALGLEANGGCYNYLGDEIVDAVDDGEEFGLLKKSLTLAGFSEEAQWHLWTVLAAILHIGNISFAEDEQGYAIVENGKPVKAACKLLQIDESTFAKWLTVKLLKAGNELVETKLSKLQAQAVRDSVARHLYGLLFDCIIRTLNVILRPERLMQSIKFIGVLDIYGFERFDRNSFEQFCINYANEKLQFQFNQQVFRLEQALYEGEGISWSFINFNDNQPCIEMIEGKQGILRMLAEECRIPGGSDRQLGEKINIKFDEGVLSRSKFGHEGQFTVKHFAYNVTYDVEGFLEKNRDTFPPEQLELLKACGNAFVASLFDGSSAEESSQSMSSSLDAIGKEIGKNTGLAFKSSLNALLELMSETQAHYIRCIKPNQDKEPLRFDAPFVVQQLRACGIIETIRISAAGFPGRWTFADFVGRYRLLAPELHLSGRDIEDARKILEAVQSLKEGEYQVGKTQVFLRAGVLGSLEDLRTLQIRTAASCIQANARALLARLAYIKETQAIKSIQQAARFAAAHDEYSALRRLKAVTCISSAFQRYLAVKAFAEGQVSATSISTAWRSYQQRLVWAEHQRDSMATLISSAFKGWTQRQSQQERRTASRIITSSFHIIRAKQELKGLRTESRSVAKLLETSSQLERKIMDLSARLQRAEQAVEAEKQAKAELKSDRDDLEKDLSTLRKELESALSERYAFDVQLREERERSAGLKKKLQEAISQAEGYKEALLRAREKTFEKQAPTMGERAMSTAELLLRHDDAQRSEPPASRRHLRKLSMDSKLGHIAELELPRLEKQPMRQMRTSPQELMAILGDPRLIEELHEMVQNAAGFDPRKEQPPIFLRLPALILENWISTWLDLDPEPLHLGDHFHNLLGSVKNLCIRSLQPGSTGEGPLTIDQRLSLWIGNLVELLGHLQYGITSLSASSEDSPSSVIVVSHEQQMSTSLLVLLQMRQKAARAVEEVYRNWLAELCKWFARLGPAALMDHQGLTGYSEHSAVSGGSRFLNSLLGRRHSNPQLSTEVLLDGLEELTAAMGAAGLQDEIAEQLLSSLLAHILSLAFNELLVRKSYATWRRGIQIQYNLSQLEDWATRLRAQHPAWLPTGPPIPHSEPLLQAVKLLQLAKSATTEDIPVIQEACPALSTAQIRRILSIYVPDEFEDGPVCPALMRALALKCQQEEMEGATSELLLPEVHPDAEPLHLSIKPLTPSKKSSLPAASVPPTLWKLFILTG